MGERLAAAGRRGRIRGQAFSQGLASWRVAGGHGWSGPWPPATRHEEAAAAANRVADRKSTRLNSSHSQISYAVFCLKKKKKIKHRDQSRYGIRKIRSENCTKVRNNDGRRVNDDVSKTEVKPIEQILLISWRS